MFNLLITGQKTAWETDQLMRMDVGRFKEHSGVESRSISLESPDTLQALAECESLLAYEWSRDEPYAQVVRVGYIRDIKTDSDHIVFRFQEEGWLARCDIEEFADRLGMNRFEFSRTHWAIKDGGIPTLLLQRIKPTTPASKQAGEVYDVALSFAGEQREYVEQVADILRQGGLKVFYDRFHEVDLWGKDLAEHFDTVFRKSARYCMMFVSKEYGEKMWTRHERRSALARALEERREFILPVRFDDTDLPGLSPTIGFVKASTKTPQQLAQLVLEKLKGE